MGLQKEKNDRTGGAQPYRPSKEFNRVVRRARAAIFYERLAPKLLPPAATGSLFLSATWLGLWAALPPVAAIAGVASFMAAFAISPFLVKSGSLLVSKKDALARIDQNAGNPPERPARSLADKVPAGSDDTTQRLWSEHQRRVEEKWKGQLKAGKPDAGIARRDRYKMRYALTALTVLSAAVAGDQIGARLKDAFNWHLPEKPVAPVLVEAWITPPDYTKEAPVYLTHNNDAPLPDSIPEGSVMTVLSFTGPVQITREGGGDVAAPKMIGEPDPETGIRTAQYDITWGQDDNCVSVANGPRWCFAVKADQAPSVTLGGAGESQTKPGSLAISCKAADDYGIAGAEVVIEPVVPIVPGAKPLPNATVPPAPLRGGSVAPCPGGK